MLNVAVIRSVNYYLDQVARSRAEYYLGRGEAPGRWLGSLSVSFGLSGTVAGDDLRKILEGRDPATGSALLFGRRDVGQSPARRRHAAVLDAAAAAAALGVSTRTARRWAAAGEELWRAVQAVTPDRPLRTPGDVHARLAELSAGAALAADSCLLVPPATDRRRRWEIPKEEVDRLRSTRRAVATRQGYDLVFRPAKGYSVLWAVGPAALRRAIADIHREAVADALAYVEQTCALARTTVPYRGRRVRMRARGEGLVVACFDHRESRANDPLLHTHCLVANLTRLPGGRIAALEPSMLFRQQRAADAVYQATFRHLAERRLGIESVPGPAAFPEPVGVPDAVLTHFSKRSEEIAEEVERQGSASAATRQLAALATRRAKEVATRSEELHTRWRAEADDLGFGEGEVAACLGRATAATLSPELLTLVFSELAGADGLTSTASTFTRGDVVRALGAALGGAVPGSRLVQLADTFLATDDVIVVREHRPGRPRGRILEAGRVVDDLSAIRFSVPELATIEDRLMLAAGEDGGPVVEDRHIETILALHPALTAAQAAMARMVCQNPALMRPVVGLPGSGKTTATAALVQTLEAAGVPVIGCAVTATAAAELALGSGLRACDTVARTLVELDVPGVSLRPGTVVVVDEASTLPLRDLDRLLRRVRAAGGALVLIGDPHQHGAVGPGGFFSWLAAGNREISTLTDILRQRDVLDDQGRLVRSLAIEREASKALREGQVAASLQLRDEAGLVVRAASPAELFRRMVSDWSQDWPARRDPMVAASNDARSRLNTAARMLLREGGVLTGPVLRAGGLEFQAGDWIVTRRNRRDLRAQGDPTWWVRNGACGEVVAVDTVSGGMVVDFAGHDGRVHQVVLPAAYVAEHVEHGYSLTDYAIQGRTLTRSRTMLDEASTAPGTYVATTRGAVENRLYVVEGDVPDTAALDLTHGSPVVRNVNLEQVAARIDIRRPDPLLHERDPVLKRASDLASCSPTDQLRAELERLTRLLEDAPSDPSRSLASGEAARTSLTNRTHELEARLRRFTDRGEGKSAEAIRASKNLAGITADLRRLDATLERLRERAARRAAWEQSARAWGQERAAVAEALAARDAKARLARHDLPSLDVAND